MGHGPLSADERARVLDRLWRIEDANLTPYLEGRDAEVWW